MCRYRAGVLRVVCSEGDEQSNDQKVGVDGQVIPGEEGRVVLVIVECGDSGDGEGELRAPGERERGQHRHPAHAACGK